MSAILAHVTALPPIVYTIMRRIVTKHAAQAIKIFDVLRIEHVWSADTRSSLLLVGLSMLLALVFFNPIDNWRWDPSFYYAQLRSPVIEHDLSFQDETIPPGGVPIYSPTGLQPSPWPIGTSLLWAPFFLLAHAYMLLRYGSVVADGCAVPYLVAVAAGSLFYGLLGLFSVYRTCRLFGGVLHSFLIALLTVLATPLFYYMYRQPFMAHSTSFFAASTLVYVCVLIDRAMIDRRAAGAWIGLLVGLNMLVRWTSVLLTIIPPGLVTAHMFAAVRTRNRQELRMWIVQSIIAVSVAFIMALPQLALWHTIYGRWVVFPSQGFSTATFVDHVTNLLISANRGLIFWSPFIIGGMIGTVLIAPRWLRHAAITYLIAHIVVLGLWRDWYGGGGFGPRYFIETLPVITIGWMALLQRVARKIGLRPILAVGTLFVFHQLVLVIMVEQGWMPMQQYYSGQPIDLLLQLAAMQRVLREPGFLLLPRALTPPDWPDTVNRFVPGYAAMWTQTMLIGGVATLLTGTVAYLTIERLRVRGWLIPLTLGYMCGWVIFLIML